MALTDRQCRLTPTDRLQKLSDGGGLQLWIQPKPVGSRLWRLAYRFSGKQKLLALGAYPIITLAEARKARDEAKRLLASGIDPSEVKKQAKAAAVAEGEAAITFRQIAEEYVAKKVKEARADATLFKLNWLLEFAYPALGDKPIRQIRTPEVHAVLKEVEARGRFETARRLRATIGSVFRHAMATGRADMDPTVALHGALTKPPVRSRAAVTEAKAFAALLRAVDGFDGQPTTTAALKLMALLFPRPGELRFAEWPEFDLDQAVWTVPAERMKMRRSHQVPLSRQALAILNALKPITGRGRYVFPSVRTTAKPLSETTLNAALRRLGYGADDATPHGFRASASTLLNESGRWNPDAIERQLAHEEGNKVRRAYARSPHWDERIEMMQWWADYCDELKNADRATPQRDNTAPLPSANRAGRAIR